MIRLLIRFLSWLLGFPPRRTFEAVAAELVAGLEDGSIVLTPEEMLT